MSWRAPAILLTSVLLAGCGAQALPGPGAPRAASAALAARELPGQWVAKLRPGVKPAAWARARGLAHVGAIGLGMHRFAGAGERATLKADREAAWVEADRAIKLPADLGTPFRGGRPPSIDLPAVDQPNDPLIPAQYGRAITGADGVWGVQRGAADVVVAVIDSGVDGSHPELAGQLLPGWDVTVNPPREGGHVDGYGHGTHVAGVIGAKADNGVGIAGVAPGCKILPVRIFNDFGHSSEGAAAAAVIWAVDHGAKVINASWGSPMPGAAAEAAYQYALQKDVVFVAAVGNSGSSDTEYYPGATEGVIGVAATNDIDGWGSFSTFGAWVDIAAPGEGVLSTYPMAKGNGYRIMRGTSMASPMVAAAAALVRSQYPSWDRTRVTERLYGTAKDVIQAGVDPYSGHGRVDIGRALLDPVK